jgi:hypothetical protein
MGKLHACTAQGSHAIQVVRWETVHNVIQQQLGRALGWELWES